ncbi:MAG TPA: hypothetical protein IAC84_01570 [Firmicutes bacterium]|nr:hypothetical protein [Bacillota bacterium]
MWQIGVWEQNEGLAERVSTLAPGGAALVRACRHPALLAGLKLDLLVVSPGATGWAGAPALSCHTALLPGGLAALTRALPAETVVSYGAANRNTLTLSSLEQRRAAVAVQREFIALDGRAVERQELVLPYDGTAPDLFLVLAGAALLLGQLPEGTG